MTTLKITQNIKLLSRFFSDENLTKKAYLNTLAAALDYGARLLVGFVLTPFLVSGLGEVMYGVWITLGRLTEYLTAASGRSSQALKWTIANMQASTDYDEKRRNVGSAVLVWLFFLPLLGTLSGVLVWFAPHWIQGVSTEAIWVVRLAAGLLAFKMIMMTLTYVPEAVLEGENLGYKRIGLSAALVIIGGGFTLLALYLETGLIGVAAATLATILLRGLLYLWVVRHFVPWFGLAKPSRQAAREFLGLSGWFLIWRLVTQLMSASDVLILGLFASVELVTTYSLTKYAPETMVNFVGLVAFGIAPGLGGIIGQGDLQKAVRVRSEIMQITWLVVTVLGSTILLLNQPFIGLWVGADHYAGPLSTLLILLMVTQLVFIRNDANIIDLTLNLSRKVLLGLLSVVLSVGLAILLVRRFETGISGLVVGLIAGRLVLSLAYPLIIGRFLVLSFKTQLLGILRPALITGLFFWFSLQVAVMFSTLIDSWLRFIFAVPVTAGLVVLLAFVAGLTRDQQGSMLGRAQKIFSFQRH